MPIPEVKPEGLCTNCIQPCVENDGECTGPVTEEEQRAINQAIIFEYQQRHSEKPTVEAKPTPTT